MDKLLLAFEDNIDRRQRKTHIAVESALLELMKEQNIDKITISTLAEKADINRKTFYNNYSSIDDVLESIESKITHFIFDALPEKLTIDNEIEIYNLILDLTKRTEPYKDILGQISHTHNIHQLKSRIEDSLLPYVHRNLTAYQIDNHVIPYINRYILNGIFAIFSEWFDSGDTLSINQIALLTYNLTTSAMRIDNYKDLTVSNSIDTPQ